VGGVFVRRGVTKDKKRKRKRKGTFESCFPLERRYSLWNDTEQVSVCHQQQLSIQQRRLHQVEFVSILQREKKKER